MVIFVLVLVIVILSCLLLLGKVKPAPIPVIKDKPIKEINIGQVYVLNNGGDPFKNKLRVEPLEIKDGFVKYKFLTLGLTKFERDEFTSESCETFLLVFKQEVNNNQEK